MVKKYPKEMGENLNYISLEIATAPLTKQVLGHQLVNISRSGYPAKISQRTQQQIHPKSRQMFQENDQGTAVLSILNQSQCLWLHRKKVTGQKELL